MSVTLDSKMPQAQQEQAKKIIQEFLLDDLKVHYDEAGSSLVFEKDRRVVSVPVVLIEKEEWKDIRFLFRATLGSANSLWNTSADTNDWSTKNFYKS